MRPVDSGSGSIGRARRPSRRTALMLAVGLATGASAAQPRAARAPRRPVLVVPGVSVQGVRPGMSLADVRALGIALVPEGVGRAERTGWQSGPLLILVDPSDRVVLVSVTLRASDGLDWAGRRLPSRATLPQIARVLRGCRASTGSGGRVLTCATPGAADMTFYDSFGGEVWLHLGPG